MLARKLDNAAYEIEQQYTIEEVQIRQQQQKKADTRKVWGSRVIVLMATFLATYMYSVWRSADVVHYGNEIIALQRQEVHLINKNNELKRNSTLKNLPKTTTQALMFFKGTGFN